MKSGNYEVCSPAILGGEMSEAEVLGASVWLWMHSAQHRDLPLHCLPTVLLPVIKRQQFVLVSHDRNPLFFMSWMWMDNAAERRYLTEPAIMVREHDWASGERLWIRDWIAPFGDTLAMSRLVVNTLFPECCFRSLYHRGDRSGRRVINFKGRHLTHQQARAWRAAHPLSVSIPETPARMLP